MRFMAQSGPRPNYRLAGAASRQGAAIFSFRRYRFLSTLTTRGMSSHEKLR